MVQLAEPLVDAAPEPAHAHDVPEAARAGACRLVAREMDGLGEVGGILVWVVDDAAAGEVRAGLVCDGV